MAWSIYKRETKDKEMRYVIHTSFRKNGVPSSATCGIIYNIEKLKKEKGEEFDAYIKSEGERLYNEWKTQKMAKHEFTYIEGQENENYKEIYSGQIYLRKIWNDLGLKKEFDDIKRNDKRKYKFDLNEVMFYLASKQLIDSSSKNKAYKDRAQYLFCPENLTLDSLYDSLDVLAENADDINKRTYNRAKKYLDKSSKLYFYDVTSVNVSKSCNENDYIGLKKGKEGIFGPIIQIGYLCDEWGLLVGLHVFNGKKNEQSTLKEQITKVYGETKVKSIVICTDAGLCSIKNKRYSERVFKGYITTQPLSRKKVPDYIRDWAIEAKFDFNKENLTKEEIIKAYEKAVEEGNTELADTFYNKTYYKSRWYLTTVKIDSKGTEKLDEMTIVKADTLGEQTLSKSKESLFELPEKGKTNKIEFEQRLVVSFSLKYYYKQLEGLEKDRLKAESAIANNTDVLGASKKDFRRFLKTTKTTKNGEVIEEIPTSFLEDEYEYEKSLCGLYCQATNLFDKEDVIYRSARERWIIEYAFRTAKTNLGMRKVYLRTLPHIYAHFEICLLAQTLLRVFSYKIYNHLGYKDAKLGQVKDDQFDVTQDKIIEELATMHSSIQKDNNKVLCILSSTNKNYINKLFAEVFKFSLTMQIRPLDDIKSFLK